MTDQVELLFFDTFAHDNSEEINLDLVQFPQPVYVTEVRIIPLGARVQADFPGGVRLGATNPSQFQIEFFVNDLGKRGASTFETLGGFEYDQNGCINLECAPEETIRKIPTDGLVLKGWYTTITLAVYGTLTNNITEQIVQPVTNQSLPSQPNTIADAQQICSNSTIDPEWHSQENVPPTPLEYTAQPAANYNYNSNEQFPQEFGEYYTDIPKDPRSYHHSSEGEWDNKGRPRVSDTERDRDRDRTRDIQYQKGGNVDRDLNRTELDRRDKERRFSRSESRDRDRQSREYREADTREQEQWADAEQKDYHGQQNEPEWNERERTHERERNERFKYDDSYRRGYNRGDDRERDERKRPRTPPIQSPKRPHTPFGQEHKDMPLPERESVQLEEGENQFKGKDEPVIKSPIKENQPDENLKMDVEEFEPILSDEDILDDTDHYQDMDYDYSSYTINDDIIKLFTPGVTELKKYPRKKDFVIKDNLIEIEDSLKNVIGIADDYLKSSITKYEMVSFNKLNTEIKEEFIHLCEKLISTIGPSNIFCGVVQFYMSTKSMSPQNMTPIDKELFEQVSFVVETIIEWQKIALNYELANIQDQPAYKIRHIKCGVKLADWSCASSDFVRLLYQNNIIIHKELLDLYNKEFMALSIKLMILKALDTYLQNKFAIEKFLLGDHNTTRENGYCEVAPITECNGYTFLIKLLQKNPLVRLKFALQSIVRKLNLYEVLHKMYSILIQFRNASHDISAEEINLITKSLNQIHSYCQSGTFNLSQPKRFLPVASQFEILRNNNYGVLVEHFKMFNLLQCFVLLLTHPSTLNLPLIKTPIFEIVSFLLKCPEGLQYLSENIETVDVLLKCLLHSEEELQYQNYMEMKSHQLGLKLAYSLQSLYHIECLLDFGKKNNFDFDCIEIINQLHGLFCLTFNYTGKVSVAEILGMDNNIDSLTQFIEHLLKEKSETFLNKTRKSSGIEYIVDLITFTVVFVPNISLLEKYHKVLLHLASQQEVFEENVSNRLNELKQHLIPFETATSLSYDNTSPYLEIIDKCSENFIYNIGSITVSLRILHYLGVSPHDQSVLSENPLCHFVELKYKHVILQLYSLDGISIMAKLLQKIYEYYEQPGLHSFILVSNKGVQLLNIIHIAVLLIQKMYSYAIQCRNILFKDLTTIPVLLQTYNLLNSFPNTASGYMFAQDIKAIIIDTLLVYTQPVSEEVTEKDTLNKTLWTQMCGEVIKYVTMFPNTFISGLLMFSELLPLPLPIQTSDELSAEEISWIINLRKLWSAHLHPHSAMIQDMVNKLCISTQPQLLNLLRRICVQIADLAANSAIMIARGILDSIYDAVVQKEEIKSGPCNSYAARLLNFLACLVTHNTIKCAVLHLIHTNSTVTLKTDEKYVSLIPAFVQIVKNCNSANNHIQAQECILSIIQSFCDCEIALLQTSPTGNKISSDEYLANAMPVKEHLLGFIQLMLDHLITENSFVTYLPIVRTFLLLTEHDYGFYNLKDCFLKKNDIFTTLLKKLADQFSIENAECLSTLNTLVEFLRVSVTVEEDVEPSLLYTSRKIKLTLHEMKTLIGWPSGNEKVEHHPLITLEGILKKAVEENKTFESFLESVSALLKVLEEDAPEGIKKTYQEVLLPAPETLLIQYANRTIFSSADASDERLTTRYWLATPAEEGDSDLDNVTCDLIELCRQTLPPDFNLVREAEKLCRISSSENANEKETRMNDDNNKMKKPFVTPMRARGFARSVPQRPDLFRSRPPNTSRPPSLHVDDFVALETCGAQPTGPTGYNKISRELLASTRIARGTRGRAFVTSERSVQYRQMPWWGAGMGRGPY